MSRPPVVRDQVVAFLSAEPRAYTPAAIAHLAHCGVRSVFSALDVLLESGEVVGRKHNERGFAYRHRSTPETAPVVEVRVAKCLAVAGVPVEILRDMSAVIKPRP